MLFDDIFCIIERSGKYSGLFSKGDDKLLLLDDVFDDEVSEEW
jgi:hypothetical protein